MAKKATTPKKKVAKKAAPAPTTTPAAAPPTTPTLYERFNNIFIRGWRGYVTAASVGTIGALLTQSYITNSSDNSQGVLEDNIERQVLFDDDIGSKHYKFEDAEDDSDTDRLTYTKRSGIYSETWTYHFQPSENKVVRALRNGLVVYDTEKADSSTQTTLSKPVNEAYDRGMAKIHKELTDELNSQSK